MDPGRSRGEREPGGQGPNGRWPDEDDSAGAAGGWAAPEWVRRGAPQHTWLHVGEEDVRTDDDPARYHVADYRDRMLSGPVAELYGVSDGKVEEYHQEQEVLREFASQQRRYPDDLPPSPVPRQAAGEQEDTGSGLVRPYFRTKGRTKPSYDLALEALVSTSERGRLLEGVRVPEHRSICDLCLDTRSVAEVAALLGMPLGVVRVLVGDVAGLGLVLVHSASSAVGDRPSVEFMERVLSGLRRI